MSSCATQLGIEHCHEIWTCLWWLPQHHLCTGTANGSTDWWDPLRRKESRGPHAHTHTHSPTPPLSVCLTTSQCLSKYLHRSHFTHLSPSYTAVSRSSRSEQSPWNHDTHSEHLCAQLDRLIKWHCTTYWIQATHIDPWGFNHDKINFIDRTSSK